MNKNAIKKFAMAARTRLIATVSDKAGELGITIDGISEPSSKGVGFEVYKTSAGTEVMLQGNQIEQRRRLVGQIKARGFEAVVEEVAYTWFNRICAIRFMEVNDYLPTRVRVLSSLQPGKNEPDLLTEAPNVDLDFTDSEREFILQAKIDNRLDELFSKLFIKQCNKLSEILPELFESTEDYTEMLLSLSYTNEDDVVRMLVDGVDEADFNVTTPDENGNITGQVEIIGWLYQYYNTELKDDTFAQLKKNVKISKERIPAATQLFTPDWIVRYMVENSVGRIWIEHLRASNPETNEKATAESLGWKYYLPEAAQEPDVDTKLAEIRKSYTEIKPEDILCIDPCMGSGHIIVAMFDVLMDIYKSVGYGERDAVFEIVEHNLHGLDIDKRAYQLAYFAVMMKGRQYNRRFFSGRNGAAPQIKVYTFEESNDINRAQLKYLGAGLNDFESNNARIQIDGLMDSFTDAREYGSILEISRYDWELLRRYVDKTSEVGQISIECIGLEQTQKTIQKIINIGELLANKYDVVITNPPYMGASGMTTKLTEFVKKKYPDSKSDLFAVFMERCMNMTKDYGYHATINQHMWMFISAYEKLRYKVLKESIVSLIHLGIGAFEDLNSKVVQSVALVISKNNIDDYCGIYDRLFEKAGTVENASLKQEWFFKGKHRYVFKQSKCLGITGCPIAYWLSEHAFSLFNNKSIGDVARPRIGQNTGDNNRFLRQWYEVELSKITFGLSHSQLEDDTYKWIPYNKGGNYRRWYGNQDYIINWQYNGKEVKEYAVIRNNGKHWSRYIQNVENMCKPGVTWSYLTTGNFAARALPEGFICDVSGSAIFPDNMHVTALLGLLNSVVAAFFLSVLNPTIAFQAGNVANVPLIDGLFDDKRIEEIVLSNIAMAKQDWDAYELSWGFMRHPLIPNVEYRDNDSVSDFYISNCYKEWESICNNRFTSLKKNEEELNEIIIRLYGLQEELEPSVLDKDVTVRKADLSRDVKGLISYAVGCMLGRYSLDENGVAYAGGEWNPSKYTSYMPDDDGIIPVSDDEYFEDDIVVLFIDWLKKVYGKKTLEENLDFIAENLGNKGDNSREVIRNYFVNDFFKDHCNSYSVTGSGKRPIYWLFDSGKQNGFKALVYMHRYNQDTVGKVRMHYLHRTQKAIEQSLQSAQYVLDNSNNAAEKSRATKRISKYTKQLAEIQIYDEAIAHVANQRIPIELDDGIKENYAKFQGIEVSREGMKTVKIDLLAKI